MSYIPSKENLQIGKNPDRPSICPFNLKMVSYLVFLQPFNTTLIFDIYETIFENGAEVSKNYTFTNKFFIFEKANFAFLVKK